MAVDAQHYLRRASRAAFFLGPGLIDASFAALAGFATSLYAVNTLDAAALGAYALYFSAFIVATLIPTQLFFSPVRIDALRLEPEARLATVMPTLGVGVLLSALSGAGAALAGLLVANQVETDTLVALALTAGLLVLVSTVQDNIRSGFHLARRPWGAAAMSILQLVVALIALAAMYLLDVPHVWVPFGSLVVANTGSTIFGLVLILRSALPEIDLAPTRQLLRTGLDLLPAGLIGAGGLFAGSAILAGVASANELGYYEAARIVSRPVYVLGFGISRALSPRLMEAGRDLSRDRVKRISLQYVLALFLAGGSLLLLAGWAHPFNPFVHIAPKAYDLEGLTLLTISVTTLGSLASLPTSTLLGASRTREILLLSIAGTAARIITIVAVGPSMGAYALSVAALVEITVEATLGWKLLSRILR